MLPFRKAILLVVALIYLPSLHSEASIENSYNNDQFHIQTDEGPERYFRYQTQSGQYRKEKRLEDGTVVGSYGWIDSTGLLRLRDYIADNAGYRILRTKDVYVGRNRPISQAIKAAKKIAVSLPTNTPNIFLSQPTPITPSPISQFQATTPRYSSTSYAPSVDILHNSYPSEIDSSTRSPTTTAIPIEATSPDPGTVVISPKSTYLSSSTNLPYTASNPSSTPVYVTTHRPLYSSSYISSSHNPTSSGSSSSPPNPIYNLNYNPPLNSNAVDYYEPQLNPYIHHNGPTYPIDRNGNSYFGQRSVNRPQSGSNTIESGYQPQYSQYDGMSVTNDGFRYYIPRAYHEEQDTGYTKSGSFGYIDPFGIRRVVYYNAGADGFQHRKNNRYVGFNATPYDPRPYKKKK